MEKHRVVVQNERDPDVVKRDAKESKPFSWVEKYVSAA